MSTDKKSTPQGKGPGQDPNLAEDVLRQAGKSEDEVERMGKVDRADDEVERMFADKHRTSASPVHRGLWERHTPLDLFRAAHADAAESCQPVMKRCLEIVQAHRAAGTLYDSDPDSPGYLRVRDAVLNEVAKAGYFGMLIEKKYGGQEASFRSFARFLTQMSATGDPTTAGLASIHGCIGAVDPVRTFGNEAQKAYFLPKLASGESTSGFALTEPNAGSDLTALRTTAVLDGDHYVVNGEKLFISNAIEGRTVSLVVLIDGKPAILVAELPAKQDETWQVVPYGLHALKHTLNNGLRFKNFRVPKGNLLKIDDGDGLTGAYHGLNRGRVALCANASGVMRLLLRSITPKSWGEFRKTYGESIERREMVKERIARAAALIVGADALVAWCSSLLDEGYRGELECIIAKIFGSESQKEVALEIAMRTHGGRSFLEGHLVGDNLHDFLAPVIYEGECQMLSMALFKTAAKDHGMTYMLPLGAHLTGLMKSLKKLQIGGIFTNLFKFGFAGLSYTWWQLCKRVPGFVSSVNGMDSRLAGHVKFAQKLFRSLALELSGAMVKHQVKLADRQCLMRYLSQRVQDIVTMLVACQHATQLGDEASIAAADVLCQQLRMKLNGETKPTDSYTKACSKLANMVVEGKFSQIDGVPETPVLRTY